MGVTGAMVSALACGKTRTTLPRAEQWARALKHRLVLLLLPADRAGAVEMTLEAAEALSPEDMRLLLRCARVVREGTADEKQILGGLLAGLETVQTSRRTS